MTVKTEQSLKRERIERILKEQRALLVDGEMQGGDYSIDDIFDMLDSAFVDEFNGRTA